MDENWVIDASPLILLGKLGLLDLIPSLCAAWIVPLPVLEEVRRGLPLDPSTVAVLDFLSGFAAARQVPPTHRVALLRLGLGESGVLDWALANPGWTAILDDRAGRRAASALGIPCRGTVGLLALARRRGMLKSLASTLERLQVVGGRLSPEVVRKALELGGEQPPVL